MNKKFVKKALTLSVTAVAATATAFGAAGCGADNRKAYDNDKDVLVFSSQDFDKVFNPFYSTRSEERRVGKECM